MYICGKCKREMKVINNSEVVCKKCNFKHKLDTNDDQDIKVMMDYKAFRKFMELIEKIN